MGAIRNREMLHSHLSESLTDLCTILKPQLTIIDAVRILMANGPTGGDLNDVKQTNTVIASPDIVTADSYAAGFIWGQTFRAGLSGGRQPAGNWPNGPGELEDRRDQRRLMFPCRAARILTTFLLKLAQAKNRCPGYFRFVFSWFSLSSLRSFWWMESSLPSRSGLVRWLWSGSSLGSQGSDPRTCARLHISFVRTCIWKDLVWLVVPVGQLY